MEIVYFGNDFSIIKKFINNICKNKPNIQKVILFIQDNYLDIWFLVEKANIEAWTPLIDFL